MPLVLSQIAHGAVPVEIVERKSIGHPDTMCDAMAETLSRNLCRYYLDRFGKILHHNVDKALLRGGSATPAFGGGEVTAPVDIYLSGRAVSEAGGIKVPLDKFVVDGSRDWLRDKLHAFDADRHVRLHNLVRPGSSALQQLFGRGGSSAGPPLANDTSLGVGYAPVSALERLVLRIDGLLASGGRVPHHRAWGEDSKVMAVRHGTAVSLTIACALIGRYLPNFDAYLAETEAIRRKVQDLAADCGFDECRLRINAGDDIAARSVFLTVTGTSAEAGDDGEVGRGNRANGLITPGRPMTMEATAGKNPVNHVGKIYSVLARRIAEAAVYEIAEVAGAQCYLLSEIGSPVTKPAMIHLRMSTHDGGPVGRFDRRMRDIAHAELHGAAALVDQFVAGTIELF
jgi:S-adenosylmethionine synthetase